MLIRALTVTTDKSTEGSFVFTAELIQIIRVSTQTASINTTPSTDQANPKDTQPVVGKGMVGLLPAPTFNATAAPPLISNPYIKD
jgi:hypothetical protein